MPVRNHFPVFHRLKSGAYSYFWTDKCERLLPKHYKERCLDYMLKEPEPVHWKPDLTKYTFDKHGQRLPVQNHPILVKYPDQCNRGLWAGEGIVFCFLKYYKKLPRDKYNQKIPKMYKMPYMSVHSPDDKMLDWSKLKRDAEHNSKIPKMYKPALCERLLYSEILDQWISIPCTDRAMDLIDEAFGLDNYILKTHERYLNSQLAMVLRRKMLVALAKEEVKPGIAEKYAEFKIPLEEAEWIGLSTKEALELAESRLEVSLSPTKVKKLAYEKLLRDYAAEREEQLKEEEAAKAEDQSKKIGGVRGTMKKYKDAIMGPKTKD